MHDPGLALAALAAFVGALAILGSLATTLGADSREGFAAGAR